jgi:hypothetical protein
VKGEPSQDFRRGGRPHGFAQDICVHEELHREAVDSDGMD